MPLFFKVSFDIADKIVSSAKTKIGRDGLLSVFINFKEYWS
jgi:hypothetical protein